MSLFSPAFWKAAAERAIKTFAQAVLALLGAGMVNVLDVDWLQALGVGAGAAVLSVLSSVVSNAYGPFYGPSLTDEAVMVREADEDE